MCFFPSTPCMGGGVSREPWAAAWLYLALWPENVSSLYGLFPHLPSLWGRSEQDSDREPELTGDIVLFMLAVPVAERYLAKLKSTCLSGHGAVL